VGSIPAPEWTLDESQLMQRPRIGISMDVDPERSFVRLPYIDAVVNAGGVPILLAPAAASVPAASPISSSVRSTGPSLCDELLRLCDALLLTGGDDPRTEAFGEPTHPRATPIEPRRQAFDLALLASADARPELPVLGICLGMQMMALHAGGRLDQHLPDHGDRYAIHWGKQKHDVVGELGSGVVTSHHRQAVTDPGRLAVVAEAHDRMIEAVRDRDRAWYVGVQWHPEITDDRRLGGELMASFVEAATALSKSRASAS